MKRERKIALTVNHIKMEDEDALDVLFWLQKTPSERLAEVVRLRKLHFSKPDGSFPEKIEKVVHRRKLTS